jgi:hypothetical protein
LRFKDSKIQILNFPELDSGKDKNSKTEKGDWRDAESSRRELPPEGNLYPYAGMIRIRFNGYDLSLTDRHP